VQIFFVADCQDLAGMFMIWVWYIYVWYVCMICVWYVHTCLMWWCTTFIVFQLLYIF
jgi:hypothetical protein